MSAQRYLKFLVCISMLVFVFSIPAYSKDTIVIGGARPLSGPSAFYEATALGPCFRMWVKEVNSKGGIYVKQYKKKLLIEPKIYDDKSDMGTSTRLLEKLIVKDKVDLVIPPASTAFLFAAAAIANKHKYILIGAEGGATSMEKRLPQMPYVFMMLHYSNRYQMPVLAEIYEQLGIRTVAIMYIEDLHGIEYQAQATSEFNARGIDVMMLKGVPFEIKDVSPIIKAAKKLNVDAFCSFSYPPQNYLLVQQAMELGINFNALILGPGANTTNFVNTFGKAATNGIMWEGAMSLKSSRALKDFYEKFCKYNPPEAFDWWGSMTYYAGLQLLEQAIEKAGSLDNTKIRDIIAKGKFDTILGKTWFENQILARECHPGDIGQWQNGVAEVIDVGKNRTAKPIYPKPDWPKK